MVHDNDSDIIGQYLKSIGKVPLLSRQDELMWGKQMIDGKKKIAQMIKSKRQIQMLISLLGEDVEEEEKTALAELVKDPSKENIALLREYIVHLDFDILKKFAASYKSLGAHIASTEKARDVLVSSNLRLVVSIAKQYANAGLTFIDLIQEGNIGLIKAVDKFDPYRVSKLSTLATWWIRQAVIRSLSNKSRQIRIPVHMVDALSRSYKALMARFDRPPTPAEMLKELKMPNLSEIEVKEMMDVMSGPIPIHTPVGSGDDGESTYENFIKDKKELADVTIENNDTRKKLLIAMSVLSPREEKIIRLKIGM